MKTILTKPAFERTQRLIALYREGKISWSEYRGWIKFDPGIAAWIRELDRRASVQHDDDPRRND